MRFPDFLRTTVLLFAGAATALAAVAVAGAAAKDDRTLLYIALAWWALAALGGLWLGRRGVLALRLARCRGINLVATRPVQGDARITWLCAHLDSKSQPVPILVRAAGITASALSWLAALGLGIALVTGLASATWRAAWWWVAGAGIVAAVPVMASVVQDASPGALDNASGVAAVLLAATAPDTGGRVGVVLTSAEELGLAGARAWVRGRDAGTALNCDGVDDAGPVAIMYSGRRPAGLIEALHRAAERLRIEARAHRLVPGILTDGVAMADAGWSVVTLSKGGSGTLARIHRPGDDATRMTGTGIAEVADLIVATTEALT